MVKQNYKDPTPKYLTIAFIVFIIFSICLHGYKSFVKGKKLKLGGAWALSVQLDKVQNGVTKLTPSNESYLKRTPPYSTAYKTGKLMVIYPYPGSTSPFAPAFASEFDSIMNTPDYKAVYEFNTFPETANNQFFKNCHSFCIVNTRTKEIFFLNRTGINAADKLRYIFDSLKDW